MTDDLDELIEIAETPAKKRAAFRKDLELLLRPRNGGPSIARSHFNAGGHRKTKVDHNAYLEPIGKHADALQEALKRLREYPLGHGLFWLHPDFRPIRGVEERQAFRMVDAILASARDFTAAKGGPPKKRGSINLISLAAGVFEEFTGQRASATEGTAFVAFAERFHEIATGEPLAGSLTRQVRTYLSERKSRRTA